MVATPTFRLPPPRMEIPVSLLLGIASAGLLFVAMALAQMIGEVKPDQKEYVEEIVAYTPPDTLDLEDELPPPPEDEEPPPELEKEPPQLSLAQLDIALNPGTGGTLVGDFAMPTIKTTSSALGTEDFVDFSELDETPRPLPGSSLDLPRRLKQKAVSGKIVLLIKLDQTGRVLDVSVESSNLPDFDKIVASQVGDWRFTPPTREGNPVRAKARFPIPIRIGS